MKPSPVVSILLFVGTAGLLLSLIGRGWFGSEVSGSYRFRMGPVWSEVCTRGFDMDSDSSPSFSSSDSGDELECKTYTFLSNFGREEWNLARVLGVMFVLLSLAGTVCAGIAGIVLLRKPRSGLALATLITIGGAFLILSIGIVYVLAKERVGELPGWGFFLFLFAAVITIVGSIMGVVRKPGMTPTAGPPHRCGGLAVWVAQANRWFCPRCNEYL